MRYGLPYIGSKNAIAEWVVNLLPEGDVLCDLFCGGCAITHCALLQNKYKKIIINDINDQLPKFFVECINGLHTVEKHTEWVSREKIFAEKEDNGLYNVKVQFGSLDTKGFQITVTPLLSKRSKELSEEVWFTGLEVLQLSEFYVISVSDGEQTIERVLIISTEGLPDDREKAVVSSVISNRDHFYRYIAFLLGDNAILSLLETERAMGQLGVNTARAGYQVPALYEKMLQTAAEAPEKFKGIEYLMKSVS
jgi:hypothetical protein